MSFLLLLLLLFHHSHETIDRHGVDLLFLAELLAAVAGTCSDCDSAEILTHKQTPIHDVHCCLEMGAQAERRGYLEIACCDRFVYTCCLKPAVQCSSGSDPLRYLEPRMEEEHTRTVREFRSELPPVAVAMIAQRMGLRPKMQQAVASACDALAW